MGFIRKRKHKAIIRYYLDVKNKENYNRGLLTLFWPFRNEERDISSKDPTLEIEAIMENPEKKRLFEIQLKTYQPYRELVDELINKVNTENENIAADSDIEDEEENMSGDENSLQEETTNTEDINDWLNDVNASKKEDTIDMITYDELKMRVNSLNFQQRKVFDDVQNRIIATKYPFNYTFLETREQESRTF